MVRFFGTQDKFQIGFDDQAPNNSDGSAKNAWLLGAIWLATEKVWGDRETELPDFQWTWAEFLNGMADSWPWLLFEDTYPIPLKRKPDNPSKLVAFAKERWSRLPKTTQSEEKEKVFSFKLRHNLSMFMRGAFFDELWIIPEGDFYHVWSKKLDKGIHVPRSELIKTLTDAGDYLCNFFIGSTDNFAKMAAEKWRSRKDKLKINYLQILTSMPEKTLIEISGGKENVDKFFEIKSANDPLYEYENNHYAAAARMSSNFISNSTQKTLIEYIRETKKIGNVGIIDEISEEILSGITDEDAPYDQGYAAARHLREIIRLPAQETFEVENFLLTHGVQIRDISLDDATNLEALAIWGKSTNPSIFINIANGTRSTTKSGRRATLAHETCHILCDRKGALPLVEIFGSYNISASIEQRARAFAAELLAPADGIKMKMNELGDFRNAVYKLIEHFGVSREILYWQIKNNMIPLTDDESAYLRSWAGIT